MTKDELYRIIGEQTIIIEIAQSKLVQAKKELADILNKEVKCQVNQES